MSSLLPQFSFELLWCFTCSTVCALLFIQRNLASINSRLSLACDCNIADKPGWTQLKTIQDLSTAIISRNRYLEEHLSNGVALTVPNLIGDLSGADANTQELSLRLSSSNSIFTKAVSNLIGKTQASAVGVIDLINTNNITSSEVPAEMLKSILDKASQIYNAVNQDSLQQTDERIRSQDFLPPRLNLAADAELKFYGHSLIKFLPIAWEEDSQRHLAALWLTYSTAQITTRFDNAILEIHWREIQKDLLNLKAYNKIDNERHQAQIISDERLCFISHLSHDLRTPLANIQNLFYLLLSKSRQGESEEGSASSELLELGINNCIRLNSMLSDILDFTKHQAGRLIASPVKANLNQILQELIIESSLRAQQQGVTFFIENGSEQSQERLRANWGDVFVDIRHLRRILLNIISNAINHCPRSMVRISCKAIRETHLLLTIEDSGPGIPSDRLSRIFNPYSHSSNSGYGLGLALTKGLSELNGIELRIDSTVGRGSTVELTIPRWGE